MHAVIVSVAINDFEKAATYLRDEIVPRVKQAPGFVAGYWVTIQNRSQGRGTMVFDSEESAQAVANQIQQTPDEGATINSVEVGEVQESA